MYSRNFFALAVDGWNSLELIGTGGLKNAGKATNLMDGGAFHHHDNQ